MHPILQKVRNNPVTSCSLAGSVLYGIGFLGVQMQAARMNITHIELLHGKYVIIGAILLIPLVFWGMMVALIEDTRRQRGILRWLRVLFVFASVIALLGLIAQMEHSAMQPHIVLLAFVAASMPCMLATVFLPVVWRKRSEADAPADPISPAGWFWRGCGLALVAIAYLFSSSYIAMLFIPQSWGGAKEQVVRLQLTDEAKPIFDLKPTDRWTPNLGLRMITDQELALELPDHTPVVLPRSHVISIAYPAPATPEPRP